MSFIGRVNLVQASVLDLSTSAGLFILVNADDTNPVMNISEDAVIKGDGVVFINVEPAADTLGFSNTPADCFWITGGGKLNVNFHKTTDAGVCIGLSEIGGDGISSNRAGALFVTEAVQHNGTFRNRRESIL